MSLFKMFSNTKYNSLRKEDYIILLNPQVNLLSNSQFTTVYRHNNDNANSHGPGFISDTIARKGNMLFDKH